MTGHIDIHSPLKKYFGYDTFRPLQEEIIRSVLDGDDTLVIMPTGGGKSICFQIPALVLVGVTVVISPLIALMKDQVDGLNANGVSSAFYNSSQDSSEHAEILKKIRRRELKLLYVAPESLILLSNILTEEFVSLVAVDEAHCISSWGHDFRPSYQRLSYLKVKLPNTPIIALTATADKSTREDILEQLSITEAHRFVSSFDRPNIDIDVRPGLDRIKHISRFIEDNAEESGIIYCLSRKSTEDLSEKLIKRGFDSRAYHAGLTYDERTKVQEDFINDRVKIVCATIAFGMGIDKSNVRFVIHYNLPKNIEGYYQEIGRAGRDGIDAKALMFYSFADVVQLRKFTEGASNEEVQISKIERMQQFAEATSCRRKVLLSYFGEELSKDCGNCDICKNPLEFIDGTVIAQKALSAVFRANEGEGINTIVDVLRGSRNSYILSKGLDKIKTYGAGRDLSWFDWQQYIIQLANQGLLEIAFNKYNALELTPLARKVLFERRKVKLTIPQRRDQVKTKIVRKESSDTRKSGLFERLRALRTNLAKEKSVPPYVIFSDATLNEIEKYVPRTAASFLEISGVGAHKLEVYGELFLNEINSYLNQQSKGKSHTAMVSFEFHNEGKSVEEIALCKCFLEGKAVNMSAIVSPKEVEMVRKQKEILGHPNELKPYFEALNEEVPYERIRAALTVLSKE
jgi:ATP-dependent DNA helicase RecQ